MTVTATAADPLVSDPGTRAVLDGMPEAAALVTLVKATGGTACPVWDVGPVATHLCGPTAARPPAIPAEYGGPEKSVMPLGRREKVQSCVDGLIRYCSGMGPDDPIRPKYPDVPPVSDLLHVLPNISDGAVSRPPRSDILSQKAVEKAIKSGSPEKALPVLEGRLAALMVLCDRARATGGGVLEQETREAVELLARSLTGRTRWSVVIGWEECAHALDFPPSWRYGAPGVRAHTFLGRDEIGEAITRRLLEGRPHEGGSDDRALV